MIESIVEDEPQVEIVARLTPVELNEVRLAQSEMARVDMQRKLMQAGAQALWAQINAKYSPPPDVRFDPVNGVLFRHVTIPTNGATPDVDEVSHAPASSRANLVQPLQPPPNRKQRRRGKK